MFMMTFYFSRVTALTYAKSAPASGLLASALPLSYRSRCRQLGREFSIYILMFDSQPEDLGVAFFATAPGLGLIMYILTTLELPKHNLDFHLLTTECKCQNIIINGELLSDFRYS